jgi:hypothetical protein
MDRDDDTQQWSSADTAEPIRVNALMDRLLLMIKLFTMLSFPFKFVMPCTLIEDPSLALPRKDSDEPMAMKFNTEVALPNLSIERTDKLLPTHVCCNTDISRQEPSAVMPETDNVEPSRVAARMDKALPK